MGEENQNEMTNLTFEQREGIHPLPSQMLLRQISQEMRAKVWNVIHQSIRREVKFPVTGGIPTLGSQWSDILHSWHVDRLFRFSDEFSNYAQDQIDIVKSIISKGQYGIFLGFIEFIIRHRSEPYQLAVRINQAFSDSRAAYRIIDRTVVPVSSDAEADSIKATLDAIGSERFSGAHSHLLAAARELTAGRSAECVREAIHAVESTVSVLAPEANKLAQALVQLEKGGKLHPALKSSLGSLYGYASDNEGIRHALVFNDVANVDEVDAQFMFGACASFVSFLVGKDRMAARK